MNKMLRTLLGKIFAKTYKISKNTCYKFMYGKNINFGEKVAYRMGFKIRIEGEGQLTIGTRTSFNYNCSISCLGQIDIGDDCLIGENVKFYDHNHNYTDPSELIDKQGFRVGKISVGNNCWIGSNVTILNNVEIGDNVVIGADCLIYQSIPSNTLVKNKAQLIIEERK